MVTCPSCNGTCIEWQETVLQDCTRCDGRGKIAKPADRRWMLEAALAVAVIAIAVYVAMQAASRSESRPAIPVVASAQSGVPLAVSPVSTLPSQAGSRDTPRQRSARTTGKATVPSVVPGPALALPDTATDVSGTATWYCGAGSRCTRGHPAGQLVAAAGSELRRPGWRGSFVRVWSGRHHVDVQLVDWCACRGARVIDLYRAAFDNLADPGRGEIFVTVQWLGPKLPPTDVKESQ
jgi:hypothetical protein